MKFVQFPVRNIEMYKFLGLRVLDQIRIQVEDRVWIQVPYNQVFGQDQVSAQVYNQVLNQVRNQP